MAKKYRKQYKLKYKYTENCPSHTWIMIGRHGAKHLHISCYDDGAGGLNWSGGLETHWRQPPDYMSNDAPSQDKCWILDQPCWHDGTSMYVSDFIIPRIKTELNSEQGLSEREHKLIFQILENEMVKQWENKDENR